MTHLESAANFTSPLGRANYAPVGGGVITALVEAAWHQLGQLLAFFLSDYVAVYTQRNSALKAISVRNPAPCLVREKIKRRRHFPLLARKPVSSAITPGTNRARAPPRQSGARVPV